MVDDSICDDVFLVYGDGRIENRFYCPGLSSINVRGSWEDALSLVNISGCYNGPVRIRVADEFVYALTKVEEE